MVLTDLDWRRADRPRRRIGRAIEAHGSIGSTNDRARALLDDADGQGEGVAVVADEQTAGRGRRGRAWLSPPGVNLACSVAVRPRLAAAEGWQLALAAGLAARSACGRYAPVALKWPNDVVAAGGAKLGGVLVETTLAGDRVTSAVIGIGLNVNWRRDSMPDDLATAATSLADVVGRPVDRVELLGALLDELDAELVALEAGASPLERYRAACATLGTDVAVETPTGRVTGRAVDVDERGALLVKTGSGEVAVANGEIVRLRPAAPA